MSRQPHGASDISWLHDGLGAAGKLAPQGPSTAE